MFFSPIFIPCFSGSIFFRVQVLERSGFTGSRFFWVQVQVLFVGSGSRVLVQILEVAFYDGPIYSLLLF